MKKDKIDFTDCPPAILDTKVNVANHMDAIKNNGLGPADPTIPNEDFWKDKGKMWEITDGDARCRLCCNCKYYVNTSQVKEWIANTDTKDLKASNLKTKEKWKDIESTPQAYCTLLDITCSPIRTCNDQELGGPIDDDKIQLDKYKDILKEDKEEESSETEDKKFDQVDEYKKYLKSIGQSI